MFCGKCGKEIENTAKFCPYCGSMINEVVPPSLEETPKSVELNKDSIDINVNVPQNQSESPQNNVEVKPQQESVTNNPQVQPQQESTMNNPEVPPQQESTMNNPEVQLQQESVTNNPQVQPQQESVTNNPQVQPQQESVTNNPQVQPQQESVTNNPQVQPQQEYQPYNPQVQPQQGYAPYNPEIQPQQEGQNNQGEQPKKKKKKGIKILVIALIVVVVLAGGGVGGYFIYQNYLDKQAVKVISLFDDDNYDESTSIYEKYCSDNEELRMQIEDELLERIKENKNEYSLELKTYQEAIDYLTYIEEYDNTVLNDEVEDVREWLNMIKTSRDNYDYAHSALESGDYVTAIDYYTYVINEDTEYYDKAQEESLVARQKLEEQIEKEYLEGIKQEAISNAHDSAILYFDYDSAIYEIQQALISLPEDAELLELLNKYETLKAKVEEKNKAERIDDSVIAFETYNNEYTEGDLVIMTANLLFPKILDEDTSAYQLINRDMEAKQTQLITYSDQMAEDARSYSMEDYFYPSSLSLNATVGYNGGGIIAFTFTGYEYSGGAHGMEYYETYMYNLASGQRIGLLDILSISETDFQQMVNSAFEQLIGSGEEYYPDAMDIVRATSVSDYKYYLAEDGLHIYYDPYTLADYATSFVEVTIPYQGVVNFLEN